MSSPDKNAAAQERLVPLKRHRSAVEYRLAMPVSQSSCRTN
jgi:hypothetical protein